MNKELKNTRISARYAHVHIPVHDQLLLVLFDLRVEIQTQREFQRRFRFFFDFIVMDRKKRLRYPHTPNEAAMDCKRRVHHVLLMMVPRALTT